MKYKYVMKSEKNHIQPDSMIKRVGSNICTSGDCIGISLVVR